MATLVFGSIGTAVGGPIGGAIGAMVGRQLDGALFGTSTRSGPRLRELETTLSSYGQAIPRHYGRIRAPGSVIWATELQEHVEAGAGGKGQPALRLYTYTASLAVAVSSRKIHDIGRIWADGKLLRGAAGDLKVGGTLRVHAGGEDQQPDPLIAAAEGVDRCPAFRGLAYVVLEDLELSEFGNRLPALTFEVMAEEAVSFADLLGESLETSTAAGELAVLQGFSVEETLAASLATLAPVLPITIDAAREQVVIRFGAQPSTPLALGEAALADEEGAFGKGAGFARRRTPPDPQPSPVLRHLDPARDYLPATQHASGRAGSGQPDTIEVSAAIEAVAARKLVEQLSRRRRQTREGLVWRSCELDPAAAPGSRVTLPGQPGTWQVESWEWREAGIELELSRVERCETLEVGAAPASGHFSAPVDLPSAPTRLVAFELPWDATAGVADQPRPVAAVGAAGSHWSGAALYVDRGEGQLRPLGPAGRRRAVVGVAMDELPAGGPLLLDRNARVTIALADTGEALLSASTGDLAQGANLALIGEELVQFGRAQPMGGGTWQLSELLRGCWGTEDAIGSHAAGEAFALVDERLTPLDPVALGNGQDLTVTAFGRGGDSTAGSPLRLAGIGARPLSPVHPLASETADGTLELGWTRRARGGWAWVDGVDVPLAEEAERYLVSCDLAGTTVRTWTVTAPWLSISPAERADLSTVAPGALITVRQIGTRAVSLPLRLYQVP